MESVIKGLQAYHTWPIRSSFYSQPLLHVTASGKTGVIVNQRTKASSVNQPRRYQLESTCANNNNISSGLHQSRFWSNRVQSKDDANDGDFDEASELVGSGRKKRRMRKGQQSICST
jgi:hypothetical protein